MARRDQLMGLREVLSEALGSLQMTPFEIEQRLGVGHGSLRRLLDGTTALKLHHLVGFARLLEVHPKDLLEVGLPDWPAKHRLLDLLSPERRQAAGAPALPEETAAAVRTVVREELARHGIAPAPDVSAAEAAPEKEPAPRRSPARRKAPPRA